MRTEVNSAANFLVDLIKLSNTDVNEPQLLRFRDNVCEILCREYKDHWFPESPVRGSGYRCIRINGKLDPLISQAGMLTGIAMGNLRSIFPAELTMWVDPKEVSYRIGENGSICVLYEVKTKSDETMDQIASSPKRGRMSPSVIPRTPSPPSQLAGMKTPPPKATHLQQQTVLKQHHQYFNQQQQLAQILAQQGSPSKAPLAHPAVAMIPGVPGGTVVHQALQQQHNNSNHHHHIGSKDINCKESLRNLDQRNSFVFDRMSAYVSS